MLSNEEFNRALQLAGDRQEQGGQAIKVNTPRFNREETIGDLKEGIGRFRDTYKELFTGVAEPAKQFVTGQESFPEAKQQAKNAMGKAAVDTLDNIYTTTLKAVATQEEEDVTVETIQNAMIALGVDKMVEKYQTFKDDLPTPTRTDLDSFELALETGLNFAPVKGFGVGKRAIDTTVDTARAAGARVHEISPAFIRNNLRRAETEGGVNFAVQATDDLEKAFKMSFVDDTPAVLNKLERVASRNRVDGTTVRAEDLVRELAEAQVFPRVDGEVARFDDFFNYIEKQEAEVGSAINRRLEQVPTKTSLSEIKNTALQNLRNDPYAAPDLVRTENQIEQLFAGLARKYGDNLSATQVNEVRKQMNRRSKAYNKEEFEIDAQAAVGNAARQRIDKISGSTAVREANGYLAKMYKQRDIAEVFHNRKIATNEVLDSLGSWMGTLAASTIGFSMAGPGGLVIAGVAARLGSKALANILRRMRFGSKDQKMIVEAIKKDPYAVRKLIDEADGEDKALLERLLLPAPSGQTPIEVGPRGSTRPDTTSVKAVPADKQVVRGEKGRFATGYTSEPKGTEAARIRQQIEDNLNVSSSPSITDNKQGGFASFFGGNSKNPRAKALRDYISQQEKQLRGIEARGKTDSTAYKNIQKTIGEAKRMLDEAQGKAKSATTKTTDLQEEARKYDSAESFIEAQGTPVYHGTNQDFVVFGDGQSGLSATKMGSAENNYFFTDNLEEGWAYARNADKTLVPNENQFNQKVEQLYQDYIKAENTARRSGKNSDWDKAQKLLEEYETFYFDTTRDARPTNAKVLEAYLEYKKPYTHNVDGTITSGEVQEIVARAKKDGYDAVILKNVSDNPEGTIDFRSNHTIVFDPTKIKTRTQLEDIWKQANNTGGDLLEEARKMKAEGKTFEEFVGAQRENTFIHGTNKKIEGGLELKSKALGVAEPESNAVDALFVTPSDDVGVMHSRMYTKRDGKLYSVKLKPNAKIFDYSNPEHRKLLDGKLGDVQQRLIERYLIDGQLYWAATPPPKLIKKLGFDGMRAVERKAGESAFSETFGDTVYPKNAESIAIFNKNAFTEVDTLTDKQLKDIWLKAN